MNNEVVRTVEKKEKDLLGKIKIVYDERGKSMFSGLYDIISEVLKEQGVKKSDVYEVESEKENGKVKIKVKYTKLDLEALKKDKGEKEQIVAVLDALGYSEEKIESVKYEKKSPEWDGDDTKIWRVILKESFDPDESLSQQSYEISMSKKLKKLLGFGVSVSCI